MHKEDSLSENWIKAGRGVLNCERGVKEGQKEEGVKEGQKAGGGGATFLSYCRCNGSVDKILIHFLKLINSLDRNFINFLENELNFLGAYFIRVLIGQYALK